MTDHDDGQGRLVGPIAGGLALDLVTRQLLFVHEQVADTLPEYADRENFDLATYGQHPYLPVRRDDAVFECVYVADVTAQGLDDFGSAQTYDFPSGRLAHVPVEEAWGVDHGLEDSA